MISLNRLVFLIPAAALALSACAGSSDKYPSLATRDAERVQGTFAPADPTEAEPIRPVASSEQIKDLVERARDAHARFEAEEMATAILVGMGRGQSIESNARQKANIAFANLRSLRSETAIVLAELDLLYAEAMTKFAPVEEIKKAQSFVKLLLDAQDGSLAGIGDGGPI